MPPPQPTPKKAVPAPDYKTLKSQWDAAKRKKDAEDATKKAVKDQAVTAVEPNNTDEIKLRELRRAALEGRRKKAYQSRWAWTAGFWVWMLAIHLVGLGYFTSGFLLTRLQLDDKSLCDVSPAGQEGGILPAWPGKGTPEGGCWHPKTFDKAVVVLIDALRYDFTVPVDDNAEFHNRFPFMYETAVREPNKAFLRPFIADPPTSTLQRLKGLTTGTLPTFIDVGSSFSGTAVEEDNLLGQLRGAGKRVVHLGDDTWESLFPGYFEGNLSRPYDSFNVWDLHTVDEGVIEHIFPLMEEGRKGEWDVVIGHLLGVDHAGHRYGPEHPEMGRKLRQMDGFVRDLAGKIDERTVLIVMGDHGMDSKGDHGGESDDEVQAALWMYSPKGGFGRTKPEFAVPPATAVERPVNQIDLVPTLALMMGIPIPFNNLGRPIEEVFAGPRGNSWNNLAAAERVAAAGVKRYQASYFAARGMAEEPASTPGSPADLWDKAEGLVSKGNWVAVYSAFAEYQRETLARCKSLWAQFNIKNMILGIAVMGFGVLTLLVYVSKGAEDDEAVDDPELDDAEKSLEIMGVIPDSELPLENVLERKLVAAAFLGAVPGLIGGALHAYLKGTGDYYRGAAMAALTSIATVGVSLYEIKETLRTLVPSTIWGWMAAVFTLSQSIGFASNSYTIWEDSILLFFITTFGFVTALSALRIQSLADRYMAIYHSILFVVLGRLASASKLCREEQMPYCTSTYYASSTSSTSALWQLAIPFAVSLILPTIIKAYLQPTRSYEGLAPAWIGYVFRTGLFMSALYWVLDSADNGNWISGLPEKKLKHLSVYTAQMVLGLAFIAGTTAFMWAPPCVSIVTSASKSTPTRAQVAILGYGNAHGARYLLLPLNFLVSLILLSKPMGGGALAILFWQILSLVEILDSNSLSATPIGPVMLAILGSFHFFKTGHQAVLSTIQWDSAFIPLFSVRYPWSPLAVAMNTFAAQILATVCVPLLVLWKASPKKKGALAETSKKLGAFVGFFAVEGWMSMMWAGHLRRHLMLYRVFMPRFATAGVVLIVVDLVALGVSLLGLRGNTVAIGEVFGWAE